MQAHDHHGGGGGGVWATVSVQRTATVGGGVPVLPFHCYPGASRGFGYSAVVKDTGSFRSYRFALTPNQFISGRHIRSVVTGRVDGSYSFAFFASTGPKAFIVPRFFSGPYFPFGTKFSPVLITGYRSATAPGPGAGRSAGRLVHERARQPAPGREHHRLLAAPKPP